MNTDNENKKFRLLSEFELTERVSDFMEGKFLKESLMKIGFMKWPPHLQKEFCDKSGIEKVDGFAEPIKEISLSAQPADIKIEHPGGWKYDYNFLKELSDKVSEQEFGDGLGMEQVEAVLIAINYPQPEPADIEGKPDFTNVVYLADACPESQPIEYETDNELEESLFNGVPDDIKNKIISESDWRATNGHGGVDEITRENFILASVFGYLLSKNKVEDIEGKPGKWKYNKHAHLVYKDGISEAGIPISGKVDWMDGQELIKGKDFVPRYTKSPNSEAMTFTHVTPTKKVEDIEAKTQEENDLIIAGLQIGSDNWKDECDRLSGLVEFWQKKYYELNPGFQPPKIDNLSPKPKSEESNELFVWVSGFTEIDKARFWSKVKQTDYCWEWQGQKNENGYGKFRINKIDSTASRIAYQIINGAITNGLHVLHKCDNPGCVNPDHLFTGTHQDNMTDMSRKGRGKTLGKSSKYRGVVFRKDSKKWRAYLTIEHGKHLRLGCFETEIEAAKARDAEIIKRKLPAKLNFE